MLEICASYQVKDIEKPFQKEKYNKEKIHQLKINLTIIIIMYFNVYVLFDFFHFAWLKLECITALQMCLNLLVNLFILLLTFNNNSNHQSN